MAAHRCPSTISLAQAAKRAGIARPLAYALAVRAELPFRTVRVDRRLVVPVAWFEAWLATRRGHRGTRDELGELAALDERS